MPIGASFTRVQPTRAMRITRLCACAPTSHAAPPCTPTATSSRCSTPPCATARPHRRCVFELFGRRLPGGRRFGVVAGTGRLLSPDRRLPLRRRRAALPARRAGGGCRDPRLPRGLPVHRLDHRLPRGRAVLPGLPHPHGRGDVRRGRRARDPRPQRAEPRLGRRDRGRPHEHRRGRPAARRDGLAPRGRAVRRRRRPRRLHRRLRRDLATSRPAGRWGIPTMGTAAHAWTLLHDTEEDAFRSQIEALGVGHDPARRHLRHPRAASRRPSGSPAPGSAASASTPATCRIVAAEVRAQLDELGATGTKITVTSDLDEYAIAALAASPVDSYGVGTSVVTGSGTPTAGMVYKLVARQAADGVAGSPSRRPRPTRRRRAAARPRSARSSAARRRAS